MKYAAVYKIVVLLSLCMVCTWPCNAKGKKDTRKDTKLTTRDLREKIDRMMDYYAENDNFNGTVLVARKGEVLFQKGYGYKDVARKTKNDEHTIYQVGSNTKQFTAEVILQLDSRGKMGIEDKVSKYLPDFPNGDKITVKNLMTHTSGIYNYTRDSTLVTTHLDKPVTKEEVINVFKDKPLSFVPSTRYEYSNSNYFLLGCIIEKVAKRKYEREVRLNILKVCDMGHSGFDFTHLNSENKAKGYYFVNKDGYKDAPVTDSSLSFSAGALYSTVGDLYNWHKALKQYRLLPKDWQEIAFIPNKNQYALGWQIENMFGKKFEEHEGAIAGFTSFEIRQEQDDVFVVLLQNNMGSGTDNATIGRNLVKCLYDPAYRIPGAGTRTVCVNPTILKSYVGEYQFTTDLTISITLEGGSLFAQAAGQPLIQLVSENQTLFHTLGVDAKFEFVKNENGVTDKVILHQNGQHLPGTRIK